MDSKSKFNVRKWKRRILTIAYIALGNGMYALTVKIFLLNSGMITGGTTGISMILNKLFGIEVAGFVMIFNLLMLVIGWIVLGKNFALTTVASTFLYPILLKIWDYIIGEYNLTEDMILNSIFAGLGMGISLGLVIRAGASTGGMDIPALIVRKKLNVPLAACFYVFDFVILLVQGLFTEPTTVMYGILNVIIYTIMMDKMLIIGRSKTEVKIITSKPECLKRVIMVGLNRGLTILKSEGGYTGEMQELILVVISNRQLPYLERIVHEIDEKSFMIISRVSAVKGNGFSLEKKEL